MAWRVFILFFKNLYMFRLNVSDDVVVGIVQGSHSVLNLNYLSIDHTLSIQAYQRVIPI